MTKLEGWALEEWVGYVTGMDGELSMAFYGITLGSNPYIL